MINVLGYEYYARIPYCTALTASTHESGVVTYTATIHLPDESPTELTHVAPVEHPMELAVEFFRHYVRTLAPMALRGVDNGEAGYDDEIEGMTIEEITVWLDREERWLSSLDSTT